MKFADVSCSQNNQLGHHYSGPKTNDIVRYLTEYASQYGHTSCTLDQDVDVIFTNDIWPKYILESDRFKNTLKVKRMDGVFSHPDKIHRNEALNEAACQADHVIFISRFSANSYFEMYDKSRTSLKAWSIVPNQVDYNVFYPEVYKSNELKVVVASASDWNRPEKRLNAVISLAELAPKVDFIIIGKLPDNFSRPKNVRTLGYLNSPEEIAKVLRNADAMVSLGYRDPLPKTMIQGAYCGLPILYTGSGGQVEVMCNGTAILDDGSFENGIPILNHLEDVWNQFEFYYPKYKENAMKFIGRDYFHNMLKSYYKVFEKV